MNKLLTNYANKVSKGTFVVTYAIFYSIMVNLLAHLIFLLFGYTVIVERIVVYFILFLFIGVMNGLHFASKTDLWKQ